ncbi:hypothetical protein BD289DRAFT_185496 [Coniella lustricola]|uniref:Uncharacterized protein n=1 Tax=Coniella lustricola TaxID=2025994 RepID=A0A2T2ZT32_9PEZI|nr:hypothetical protein BD289DRAFT_185496 [Coniella lustricola]
MTNPCRITKVIGIASSFSFPCFFAAACLDKICLVSLPLVECLCSASFLSSSLSFFSSSSSSTSRLLYFYTAQRAAICSSGFLARPLVVSTLPVHRNCPVNRPPPPSIFIHTTAAGSAPPFRLRDKVTHLRDKLDDTSRPAQATSTKSLPASGRSPQAGASTTPQRASSGCHALRQPVAGLTTRLQ